MEFIGNRLELLEMSKKAEKLAKDNSPIEALKGIYLECNDDLGEVTMIATDYAAAISLKEKASVSRNGKVVINAKLLTGMLSLLTGEQVEFSADENTIKVSSGTSFYKVYCLPGEHYPKPVMPLPNETVKLSGICDLAKRTVFAVSKDSALPALQCICLKVKQNSAIATASDKYRIMLAKGKAEGVGVNEFLIPAQSFQVLASISSGEDVYDIGSIGKETVFMKENLVFSIKQPDSTFIDTDMVIKSIKPQYSAIASAKELFTAFDLIAIGSGAMPVNILFTSDVIRLKCNSESGASKSELPAELTGDMPKSGFYYRPDSLLKLLRLITGKVKIEIDDKGMMLVKAKNEVYFQLPAAAPKKKQTAKKEPAA